MQQCFGKLRILTCQSFVAVNSFPVPSNNKKIITMNPPVPRKRTAIQKVDAVLALLPVMANVPTIVDLEPAVVVTLRRVVVADITGDRIKTMPRRLRVL